MTRAILFGYAIKSAQQFATRKAELVNQWVGHVFLLSSVICDTYAIPGIL